MGRKITILGMGQTATERRHDIEQYCKGTEIWSLNNAYLTFPKLREGKLFDMFFELHSWQYLEKWKAGEDVNHYRQLDKLGCPVYAGQPLPFVEKQVVIDWKAFAEHWHKRIFHNVAASFDLCTKRLAAFFRGSPSIMFAVALMEHDQGDRIEYMQSWGIDTRDPSHVCQRASWSFWVSQALARGIEIGGTMCNYMFDVENDLGLAGLQDYVSNKINL